MLLCALAEHYAYTFSHLATHTKLCWKYSIALCKHAEKAYSSVKDPKGGNCLKKEPQIVS